MHWATIMSFSVAWKFASAGDQCNTTSVHAYTLDVHHCLWTLYTMHLICGQVYNMFGSSLAVNTVCLTVCLAFFWRIKSSSMHKQKRLRIKATFQINQMVLFQKYFTLDLRLLIIETTGTLAACRVARKDEIQTFKLVCIALS